MTRRLSIPACLLMATLALAGCAKAQSAASNTSSGGPGQVKVVATKTGCTPSPATVAAGPYTFTVSNDNASAVSEIELQQGSRILGEKENLIPGLSGSFSLRLKAGTYVFYCPGAHTDKTSFVVTAS
jgi:iron uptake system component EfeO